MKGIIIACPTKYEKFCLKNIKLLREKFDCHLPIEIWEIGTEISSNTRNQMKTFENIHFKNVEDFCDNPKHWKGFQVKVFALYHSQFKEPILCDADVTFYQNPEIIYNDSEYIRTGTYFFRDMEIWKFSELSENSNDKLHSISFFKARKHFIRFLLPELSVFFPKEWEYIYSNDIPDEPVKEALQESGVVYIDKMIHFDSIEYIYLLNLNHSETYRFIWGDKETFWLGCLMANKEFYLNPESGYTLSNCLTHNYNNSPFWKQK
jgi:hypothetical protein